MQVDAWREAEKDQEISNATPDEGSKPPTPKSEIGRGKTLIILQGEKTTVTTIAKRPLQELSESERNISRGQLQVATSSDRVKKDFLDVPIDPQLLALDDNGAEVDETQFGMFESLVFDGHQGDDSAEPTSAADAELWDSDTINDALIDVHLSQPQYTDNLSPLELDSDQFFNYFAAMNVSNCHPLQAE
jgi:hypothetical protein